MERPLTGLAKAAGLEDFPMAERATGFGVTVEMRQPAILDHPDPGAGRICLWVRRRDAAIITPALAAYLADMVPMGIAHVWSEDGHLLATASQTASMIEFDVAALKGLVT